MHDFFVWLVHTPEFKGAVNGFLSAFGADAIKVLRLNGWKDLAGYNWGAATWHWVTGTIVGAFAGAGLGAVLN